MYDISCMKPHITLMVECSKRYFTFIKLVDNQGVKSSLIARATLSTFFI